jgi:hypothetical protein
VQEKYSWGQFFDRFPCFIVEGTAGRRANVIHEKTVVHPRWDLALLTLTTPLTGDIPPFLWRVTRSLKATLQDAPLEVFGYAELESTDFLWQHSINKLLFLPSSRMSEGTLTLCQFHGGLPEGMSGSPVMVAVEDQWAYVGTVFIGGEKSATSRIIMADPVGEFLTQVGLRNLKRIDARQALALAPGTSFIAEHLIHPENPEEGPNPYRHLNAFQEIDAPYFHGRDIDIRELVAKVQQFSPPPFVALVGPSGSGKSSLVLAGVVPCLRKDRGWQIAIFRPKRDPVGELAMALAPLLFPELDKLQCWEQGNELARKLREQKLSLTQMVDRVAEIHPAKRLLLIIDKFEELYTQLIPKDLQRLFLEGVVTLIQTPTPCTILMTLRVDFLGQVMASGSLVEAFNAYPPRLIRVMSEIELRDAVEKPARLLNVELEPGLTDRILKELGAAPGSLPLLQFALTKLWKGRKHARLTHTDYEAIGGVQKALAMYADGVLAGLSSEERQLRWIFGQLVQPGVGTEDTRQVATRVQVGESNWPLVCQLADARLVVTGYDEQGQPTVEVAHEALIRHWPPLQRWMEQDRTFRLWQNRLRQDMQDWQHHDCNDEALLYGTRLAEAEANLAQYKEALSPQETAYIRASAQHRDQTLAERDRARREQERLRQRNHYLAQQLGMAPLWAGLLGGLTRMVLSWIFGSFIDLPLNPGDFGFDAMFKPFWHGFVGTYIGGLFVVFALAAFPHDRADLSFRQVLLLIAAGIGWGLTVCVIIDGSFHPDRSAALGAYHRWGYLTTGTCWGVGLALGTKVGDKVGRALSDSSRVWSYKLWAGTCGAFCLLLLSPLIMEFVYRNELEQGLSAAQNLLRRTWGEALEQSFSVWAVLTCFYRQQQRGYSLSRVEGV